jgi:hypothetical protein
MEIPKIVGEKSAVLLPIVVCRLFFCQLFSDTLSDLSCTAPDDRLIDET